MHWSLSRASIFICFTIIGTYISPQQVQAFMSKRTKTPTLTPTNTHINTHINTRINTHINMASKHDEVLDKVFSAGPADEALTILGFGSLLSETSARGSFPELKNFRLVKVEGYRRLFQHPAFIFFHRGIASGNTIASLSTEQAEGCSFLATAFEIKPMSKEAWLKREEEFDFALAPFRPLGGGGGGGGADQDQAAEGLGLMCTSAVDQLYIDRWGKAQYEEELGRWGLTGIWENRADILPCSVYLRHCVLAATSLSPECLGSFLDDTYLVDRQTTIRQYLSAHPEVMLTQPPDSLIGRYSG